jgi:ribosome biogenesis GTPase
VAEPESGLVVAVEGLTYRVELPDSERTVVPALVRGRLRHEGGALPVVGDRVRLIVESGRPSAITEVLPRESALGRVRSRGTAQTITANLDQVVVVFATVEPIFDANFCDRFLIAAEAAGVTAALVLNKLDLGVPRLVRDACDAYVRIGYHFVETSAETGSGLDELADVLRGRVSAFVGPSGVGKSALLNRLAPGAKLRVGPVSSATGMGRHTTSVAQLVPLPFGGHLADTPGIKTLAFLDVDSEVLDDCFPEFRAYLGGCRFRNCSHAHEPECAVREAWSKGAIDERRYRSYCRLREG